MLASGPAVPRMAERKIQDEDCWLHTSPRRRVGGRRSGRVLVSKRARCFHEPEETHSQARDSVANSSEKRYETTHFLTSLTRLGCLIAAPRCRLAVRAEESKTSDAPKIGRPVRIVSFCFSPGKPLEEIARRVDQEGSKGADPIVLPETWRGQNDKSPNRSKARLSKPCRSGEATPHLLSSLRLIASATTAGSIPPSCSTARADRRQLRQGVSWMEHDHKRKVQPDAPRR